MNQIATLNNATVTQTQGECSYDGMTDHEMTLFSQYGLITCAPGGSRLLLLPLNDSASNMLAFADRLERGSLPVPQEGEVILANYITGDYVHLKTSGIDMKSSGAVNIECESYNIKTKAYNVESQSSKITGGGLHVADGDVKAGAVSLKEHEHTGVQHGNDQSGPPVTGD